MNKAMLIGRLGKDPELKYTPSGTAFAKFSLAETEKWKDKDGNKQEKTNWHNIVTWVKQAEILSQYLKKGSKVYLEGKIETRSWEADGKKHYMTEIKVQNFEFLDSKKDTQDSPPDNPFNDDIPPAEEEQELPF